MERVIDGANERATEVRDRASERSSERAAGERRTTIIVETQDMCLVESQDLHLAETQDMCCADRWVSTMIPPRGLET